MIVPASFQPGWIHSHRLKKGFARLDPQLLEKMIHALSLVEQLAGAKLDFVFKGGTSLTLLLPDAGRFSIDIDIITTASRDEIESALYTVCSGKPFIKFELSEHRSYKEGIPKAHYMLIYRSALMNREDHILLDVLYDEHTYPKLLEVPVKAEWLQTDGEDILVKVPSLESIAGDKLTAFAPTTTGIPYGKGKEVEIIKQLHDVAKLYDRAENVRDLITAFTQTVQKEIQYRGNHCGVNDVYQDIIETGAMIARKEKNVDQPYRSYFEEIKRGLLQFRSYQTTSAFRIDEAIIGSAKAALLVRRIQDNEDSSLPKYKAGLNKADWLIQNPAYIHLNKLPVEALFYWYYAIR